MSTLNQIQVRDPRNLTVVGDTLYLRGYKQQSYPAPLLELWKSDGTTTGTVSVGIEVGSGTGGFIYPLKTANAERIAFNRDTNNTGLELWISDGTAAGTLLVKDINPGIFDSEPRALLAIGNILYFTARDGGSGRKLWKTDGTTAGTVQIAQINNFDAFIYEAAALGNTLYFNADDGPSGDELWKTDGTPAGTVQVADINPGRNSSRPRDLTAIGNTLYFRANTGNGFDRDYELWKSDGTPAGTVRVADINPGSAGSDPSFLTALGNTLYFRADDAASGRELWKTDGTSAGTVRVADINPGSADSFPSSLTALGNTLYFSADDGITGDELWKTDGTPAGTVRVADINPGPRSSSPYALTVIGNLIYFTARDGVSGRELWKTDGTTAGTVRVADINPGPSDSFSLPHNLTAFGDTLWFAADNGAGQTLWNLTNKAQVSGPTITLALSSPSVTEDGPSNLAYTFTRTGSTASALTVNYSLGGTATRGVDYTGIPASPATKSITFAAGSATATVTVDPTADRNQEANETVAIRLLAGSGYTLGTPSAVTGTIRNDDLIGTAARNTIVGTAVAEFIDGLQANDTLTGGVGPDVFGFRYSHSTLSSPDRITDYRFGTDKIDLFTASGSNVPAPAGFTRASNNTATTLAALASSVFTDANGALKGNQALGANKAALVVATKSSIRGTYLFINDGNAARNNSTDLVINLTGYSGALPGLGVIPVDSVFA